MTDAVKMANGDGTNLPDLIRTRLLGVHPDDQDLQLDDDDWRTILAAFEQAGEPVADDAREKLAGEHGEQCERCQGNGEIVTDWDRYMHAHDGDVGDEAVADCPDCSGTGRIEGEAPLPTLQRLGQEFDAGEGVAGEGWVYWNQDSGEEYALNHPVESGECVEAEHVRRSTGMEDHFNAEFQRLTKELAAPSHHPTAEPVGLREAQYLIKSIAEVVEKDGGCWSACSGCQESVDGYVSSRDYPYSQIFKCQPGCGCRECGGIGVVWQDGNFLASYGDALAINQTERVYEPYPGAFDDLIGPEGATTPAEHDGENVLAKLEAIRDVVAAAYYACEDSEDDGGDNIHVMRSSWEQLSASLDAIDAIMPDEVQPALPAVLVTLVMEAFATPSQPDPQSRGQAFDGEGEGWRPIESAPKDGTEIILFGPYPENSQGIPTDRVTAGFWTEPEPPVIGDCGGECRCPEYGEPEDPHWCSMHGGSDEGWMSTDGGFTREWPPTHWMPLPDFPALSSAKRGEEG